jgi:catechol 2,3-dioxygenase-like lactoylglutathione lyase family enzyme
MKLAPLICVADVEASSAWYCRLLSCASGHGGAHYERLMDGDALVLQLHRWDVEHRHGAIGDPDVAHGNGLLLWFELADLDAAVARAGDMAVQVDRPLAWSENGNREYWIRDPDGYRVVLTDPLPSQRETG